MRAVRLTPCALALVAPFVLLGCKESLFDDSTSTKSDAGTNDHPDGGGITGCAAPCLGDAVGEWNGEQGGTKSRFHYRDLGRDPGHDAANMTVGQYMSKPAFLGRGTPQAAIASCTDLGGASCAGLGDALLLVPGQQSSGGADPVIEYTSAVNGTLRLSGTLAAADGASGGRQHLRLTRNARADDLLDVTFRPGDPLGSFDTEVDVLVGDRLGLLAAAPLDGEATPLGVQLYVNEVANAPSHCELAVDFEEGPRDRCHDMALERLSSDTPPVLSTTSASLAPDFGSAEHFESGAYLRAATSADYSGDFTIQFWMKVKEPAEFQATAFADWGCLEQGGINISPLDTGKLFVGAYWKDETVDYCDPNGPPAPIEIEATRPTDGDWHFYRVTRSTADAKLLICVDGKKVATAQVPADKDMTSGLQTHLARNQFSPAYFAGDLDDVRILSRALPCQ
jgi:hypothetical protein